MRKVIHISDLGIGSSSEILLDALASYLERQQPDLCLLNGGLTTHGHRSEWNQAKDFLGSLPAPQILAPGWTDRSAWKIGERLSARFTSFENTFGADRSDCFADRELAAIALYPGRFRSTDDWKPIEAFYNSTEPTAARLLLCPSLPPLLAEKDGHLELQRLRIDLLLCASLPKQPHYLSGSVYGESPIQIRSGVLSENGNPSPQWAFHVLHLQQPTATVETVRWNTLSQTFEICQTYTVAYRYGTAPFGSVA